MNHDRTSDMQVAERPQFAVSSVSCYGTRGGQNSVISERFLIFF